jgi:hypothetical protein
MLHEANLAVISKFSKQDVGQATTFGLLRVRALQFLVLTRARQQSILQKLALVEKAYQAT